MTAARRKVAVVHYWLENVRGGERVFFEIARSFPDADLFVLRGKRELLPPDLRDRLFRQTFLGSWPWRVLPYRATLPLLPVAASALDLSGYDLVISSSVGWSHGVRTGTASHLSYIHSPPRYLWGEQPPFGGALFRVAIAPVLRGLRRWDKRAAQRVSSFVANSDVTKERVARSYGRAAEVVWPPVDVDRFLTTRSVPKQDFVIAAGELVPYKRFDLAIEACAALELPLRIIGDGPERFALEQQATELGANVAFLGRVSEERYLAELGQARVFVHAGLEDFGIAIVEAAAAGATAVVAEGTGAVSAIGREHVILVESNVGGVRGGIAQAWSTPSVVPVERLAPFVAQGFRNTMRLLSERLD